MFKTATAVLAVVFCLASISFSQVSQYDGAVSGAAIFTKESQGSGVTQGATVGANIFGTIRTRFNPKHSLIFNYGRGKDSQTYQTNGDNFHVLTNISEFSGAYVYNPFQKGKFEPFVLAGVGGLKFGPRSTYVFFPPLPNGLPNNVLANVGASSQTQLAFLYGLGVDYQLPGSSRFALRLQYRGFLYREPDFNVTSGIGKPLSFFTGVYGHMAEPSIGLVVRF
jgi:outer membrane immunogenic protein